MSKYLITYGNEKFKNARDMFVYKAKEIGVFDNVCGYSEFDVTEELAKTKMFKQERGGGYWTWKPDIIYTAMQQMQDGDILVYCDAGCTLQQSKEWSRIWKKLEKYDIYAQRLFQRTDRWTRKNILEMFRCTNGESWEKQYQYLATVIILKITPFTRMFVSEWRHLMVCHQELVGDVTEKERSNEHKCFVENRHDQAVYSALICKYIQNKKIYTTWEHIEDLDVFCKQAIRATRLRCGEHETYKMKVVRAFKRVVKNIFLKPLYYVPLQWYYSDKDKRKYYK